MDEQVEESLLANSKDLTNYSERIIFAVGLCGLQDEVFTLPSGSTESTLFWLQKAIKMFLHTKSIMNKDHKYSLLAFQNSDVTWLQEEFTSDHKLIKNCFSLEEEDLKCSGKVELDGVVCELYDKLSTLNETGRHCYRVILLVGESNSEISLSPKALKILRSMQEVKYFFFDLLYLHKLPSADNDVQTIFQFLQSLVNEEKGYLLETTENATGIFQQMSKLLAHPFQRCLQSHANYSLDL